MRGGKAHNHSLLQCGVPPMGGSPPQTPLLMGCNPVSDRLLQHDFSLRVTSLFKSNSLLQHGVLHGPQTGICSTIALCELQGLSLTFHCRPRWSCCSLTDLSAWLFISRPTPLQNRTHPIVFFPLEVLIVLARDESNLMMGELKAA